MMDVMIEWEMFMWDGFGVVMCDLVWSIFVSGFELEVVVVIVWGGLFFVGVIVYGLGVKNCGVINVEFYIGIGMVFDVFEVFFFEFDMVYFDGCCVLFVDDVVDFGCMFVFVV